MYTLVISSNGQIILNDDGTIANEPSSDATQSTTNNQSNLTTQNSQSGDNKESIKTILTYLMMGIMALFMIIMIWYMCGGKNESAEKNVQMNSELNLLKSQQSMILNKLEALNDNVNSQSAEIKRRNSAGSISVVTASGDKYEVPFPSDASFSILPKGI